MRLTKTLFHFLGSFHLAIMLIATVLIFVIAGTFLEAHADSHEYAATWTYSHPLFKMLLWLFFVNILVAALRRWPFQNKHIPFLLTHLGLLMVLGGTLLKAHFGLQGTMMITEGCASNLVNTTLIPYSVRLRQARKIDYPLTNQPFSYECDVVISDHSGKQTETTISQNQVHQTQNGTRFYMASLQTPKNGGAKRVSLVVNRNPARYLLTYPGGGILACGMILLFWLNPYKQKKS